MTHCLAEDVGHQLINSSSTHGRLLTCGRSPRRSATDRQQLLGASARSLGLLVPSRLEPLNVGLARVLTDCCLRCRRLLVRLFWPSPTKCRTRRPSRRQSQRQALHFLGRRALRQGLRVSRPRREYSHGCPWRHAPSPTDWPNRERRCLCEQSRPKLVQARAKPRSPKARHLGQSLLAQALRVLIPTNGTRPLPNERVIAW